MSLLEQKTQSYYKLSSAFYKKHQQRIGQLLLIGSSALLFVVVVALCVKFTHAHLSTGDQYDNSYLTLGWHPGARLTFLAQHTNLMKLPFLWAQATLFPYNITSLIVMNVLLTAGAVLGWTVIIHKLYKRQLVTTAVNLLFVGVLVAAPDFSGNLIEASIRNIEYPITFGYLALVWKLLGHFSWKNWLGASAILGILVASDLFFVYTVPVAVCSGLAILWFRGQANTKQFWVGATTSAAGAVGGLALLKFLSIIGVLGLVSIPRYFLPYNLLWGQVQNAINQTFGVFGADFFGYLVKLQGLARGGLAIILIMGCVFMYRTIASAPAANQNQKSRKQSGLNAFIPVALGLLFFVTLVVYVLSGFATATAENIRYITVLPFIVIFFTAYGLRRHEYLLLGIGACALLIGIVCAPSLNQRIAYDKSQSDTWLALDHKIIGNLQKNHVTKAYGTLGYSSTTWFNSGRSIEVGNLRPCNVKNPVLATSVWYENKKPTRPTALIVDRLPAAVWEWETWANCSDQKIESIYGIPIKRELIGYQQGKPLEVWYFNYDIASRLTDYRP